MKLYDLAHSRAGDKGNTLTLSVIPYREEDYPKLREWLTVDRVAKHLQQLVKGKIIRYELPNIHSLLFVCSQALEGGVTISTALDTHGKTLSYVLLDMELDWEE